ncbi:porin family protein [Flavobacteriaceae bacterium MHTCC 0001]
MKRLFVIVMLSFLLPSIYGQELTGKVVDSLYREDQFYIGATYNLFEHQPSDVKQNSFSLGFHLGYIKDMPINKRRNKSIGIGIGYSTNSYIQNILINKDVSGDFTYAIIDGATNFTKNKFSEHVLELPIEFRWRTSTISSYKFWRVYTGIKLGYVFSNRSKFRGDLGNLTFNNIEDYNKIQYGLTLSFGYNTWNIYAYYGLNPIFSKDAQLNANRLELSTIKLGLIFYVL